MTSMSATTIDERHLVLDSDLPLPKGTKLVVDIRPAAESSSYVERLREYYGAATPQMLDEEQRICRQFSSSDPPLEEEDPWW